MGVWWFPREVAESFLILTLQGQEVFLQRAALVSEGDVERPSIRRSPPFWGEMEGAVVASVKSKQACAGVRGRSPGTVWFPRLRQEVRGQRGVRQPGLSHHTAVA